MLGLCNSNSSTRYMASGWTLPHATWGSHGLGPMPYQTQYSIHTGGIIKRFLVGPPCRNRKPRRTAMSSNYM